MGMKAECDLCKKEQADTLDIVELKVYDSATGRPRSVYGAMVCGGCQRALGLGDFQHKFTSMGAVDILQRAQENELAQQRAAAVTTDINQPVPVDPRLAQRARNAR